jgi:hypothetical protein
MIMTALEETFVAVAPLSAPQIIRPSVNGEKSIEAPSGFTATKLI